MSQEFGTVWHENENKNRLEIEILAKKSCPFIAFLHSYVFNDHLFLGRP